MYLNRVQIIQKWVTDALLPEKKCLETQSVLVSEKLQFQIWLDSPAYADMDAEASFLGGVEEFQLPFQSLNLHS